MESTIGSHRRESEVFKRRLGIIPIFVVVAFSIILLKIGYLQLVEGKKFRSLSENNRIRIKRIPALRGMILDRKGDILVDNRPSFVLSIIPEDVKDLDVTINRISAITHVDEDVLRNRLKEQKGKPRFVPVRLIEDMSWEMMGKLEVNRLNLPGVIVDVVPRRYYPHGKLAAHILGYLGEIAEGELKQGTFQGYRPGDLIGRFGVEQRLETYLRGRDGGRQVEVDAAGRELMIIKEVSSFPGNNLVLTLDVRIQKVVEEAFGSRAGAVVVGDPTTGEILAITSHPSFDPNDFAGGISLYSWNELVNNPNDPLQNRIIKGQYPPGSTFKIITAAAVLQEGLIQPETKLFCPGSFSLGNREYRCWKKRGHGWVNMHEAIVQSCDVYFYQIGLRLGIDRLAHYARAFKMGRTTRFDLDGEKPGLVPTSSWKLKRFHRPWQKGETLSVAIGQSYMLVTPLQQFVAYSALVNGGRVIVPRVIDRIEDTDGHVLRRFSNGLSERIPVSKKNIQIIKEALHGVVNEPHGTGWRARLKEISVGGKTGTAQVVRLKDEDDVEDDIEKIPYQLRDHAWFIAFAPTTEKSKIVVVVLAEHGGSGGRESAPIAKKIIQEYFF